MLGSVAGILEREDKRRRYLKKEIDQVVQSNDDYK